MSRLSIELTEQEHQSIKARAALLGKSMKEYAVERLLPMTEDEEHAMQELKALLQPRVERAQRGEVSDQTIDTIFDEVIHKEGDAA
jgi:Antitoxin ParD